jgi:hypothetical protein
VSSEFYLNQLSDNLDKTDEDPNEIERLLFKPCSQPIFQSNKTDGPENPNKESKKKEKSLMIKYIQFTKPILSKKQDKCIPNYVESMLGKIEIYPTRNKRREKEKDQ